MLIAVSCIFAKGFRFFGKQASADFIPGFQDGNSLPDGFHCLLTLAFNQALAQQIQFTFRLRSLCGGQQHFRLDQHQMGCHGDKLTGDLHIQPLHFFQICQILFQNGGNGYILDLDLVFTQQCENNVQRTFKIFHLLRTGADDALQPVLRFSHISSLRMHIQSIFGIIIPSISSVRK